MVICTIFYIREVDIFDLKGVFKSKKRQKVSVNDLNILEI